MNQLSEIEQRLINKWNQTELDLPNVQRVEALLIEQAMKNPNHLAVVNGADRLTYGELEQRSAQLAWVLREKGVDREKIVGLLVTDSIWMIVAIFAILRAGGAYLPLDPNQPIERLTELLTDSQTKLVLKEKDVYLPGYHGEILALESSLLEAENSWSEIADGDKRDLAYVIYTSGSTGKPKGVMIEHQSLLNLMIWHQTYHQVTADDRSTRYAGFGFDASVWEIFPYLYAGATIHHVPHSIRYDIDALHRFYQDNQITISFLPTQIAEQFMEKENHTLRRLLVGGDRLRRIQTQPYQIFNHYGPTENTVVTTCWEVTKREDGMIPIGRPIANQQVYILDQQGKPRSIGEAGELCIGGQGLARGYLGHESLTKQQFVSHPSNQNRKIYRTGDLARWLPDGQIEFLGRLDRQLQIRGNRVEPAEIEAMLLQYEAVQEVTIVADQTKPGEIELTAYIVWKEAGSFKELRDYLAHHLPDYMIPLAWVEIEQIPLTPNGKIDYKALPKPSAFHRLHSTFAEPQSSTERRLQHLWQEILNIPAVGREDHFFWLGGHSLAAGRLVAQIRQEFHVSMSLEDCFANPILREMANWIESAETHRLRPVQKVKPCTTYPLSSVQQRLYALQQLPGIGCTYHTPVVWEIKGPFDLNRWKQAWKRLMERHEALRTSFHWEAGQLVQKVQDNLSLPFERLELGADEQVKTCMEYFIRPFQLDQAPLFRLGHLPLAEQHHVLLFDIHHLLFDGETLKILQQELSILYHDGFLSSRHWQYRDYVFWEQDDFNQVEHQKAETFWLEQLKKPTHHLSLPTDFIRPASQSFKGKRIAFSIPPALTNACKKLALEQGTTLYLVLLAVYYLLLAKYSGQSEITVGTVTDGRNRPEWAKVWGMFVRTLPLRVEISQEMSFVNWLSKMTAVALQAFHQDHFSFDSLLRKLKLPSDRSRNPLFDTVFIQQHQTASLILEGCEVKTPAIPWNQAMFDLTWEIEERDVIHCTIEYNTSLFQEQTIRRMEKHFTHLLEQIMANPFQTMKEHRLTTAAEESFILQQLNNTQVAEGDEWLSQTIIDQWTAQVQKHADQIAIASDENNITYAELDRLSNQWAHRLTALGVSDEKIVAILVKPSIEQVIAILAVLKAGGAFLPIDLNYPSERIRALLQDSQPGWIITSERDSVYSDFAGTILRVDDAEWTQNASDALTTKPLPKHLAYVIYTSGSTGQPKGVMVEHQALHNLTQWHIRQYEVTKDDRSTRLAGSSFDASIWELFPYLIAGATIYIVDDSTRKDVFALQRFIAQHQITICFLPTPLAEPFMELAHPTLRALLVGGDRLRHVPATSYAVFNNYGPTENAVVATCYQVTGAEESIPIGRPIANNRIYIMNDQQQLQPIGVPGELYIAGASLARGYLGRPDLTELSFLPDSFQAGERMYRTGDQAQWLPDGTISYLGRMDHQVQVRGHRVELQEVEQQILRYPQVEQALVLARQNVKEETILHAFVVGDKRIQEDLYKFLAERLPDYMLPAYYTMLDSFPLTPNGKVDEQALRAIPLESVLDREWQPPTLPTERLLAEVWSSLLEVESIGIDDSFFSLGGDSILAIQVVAELFRHGWKLEVSQLLQYPTIRELAPQLTAEHPIESKETEESGEVNLTPIQHWFFQLPFADRNHWNQAVMLTQSERWNDKSIKSAVHDLVIHHDALRMCYRFTGNEVTQLNQAESDHCYTIEHLIWDGKQAQKEWIRNEANRLQRSLSLEKGPMLCFVIFETPNQHFLLMIIHHLIVDGLSWRILLEDFHAAYQAYERGEAVRLLPKTTSFQAWSRQLQQYATGDELIAEIPFWKSVEEKESYPLPKEGSAFWPCRYGETHWIEQTLLAEESKLLLGAANQAYHTESNELLLAALGLSVEEWTGRKNVLIELEGHGRESIVQGINLTRSIGWFTTLYPAHFQWSSPELKDVILAIKKQLRAIPNKGIGYGVLRYLTPPESRSALSFQLRPEIRFNYLGKMDKKIQFAGMGKQSALLGNCLSPNAPLAPLEIYVMLSGEQLIIQFRYHRLTFSKQTMEYLLDDYCKNLKRIVQHCCSQNGTHWTVNDFSATQLDEQELRDFLSDLNRP
ncbi:non-ribosomal peptide synthase domain TIGR01720/amino acid adenylation domain-containing protein [Seinonella peptonophila]|uniref:Non-ribosomal peptide synthase domain TIGR01720/amino acid adenylation domain-containing protein n=1 Tax=Seinonella peptonophila TaxID=112248 RepID=A0A1M4VJG8_9BACL|nr:non-ribosomal peptide synthetase [Seinonella peptonophila]SHE68987.1 non-ribosomal peptide synthase domain TIGR01720/amino acid adenylation domain-containing protein [Seinonella peptonophila]